MPNDNGIERNSNGQYVPGTIPNPVGRPKGSGNDVDRVFQKVFNEINAGDPKAKWNLRQWAEENPGEFYKLIAKKLKAEITVDTGESLIEVLTEFALNRKQKIEDMSKDSKDKV